MTGIKNLQLEFRSLEPKRKIFYSPLSRLNSRAFPTELQVILGTALSVSNQWWGSGTIKAKSSWKLSLFVSLTPIITLSSPHSARCTPDNSQIQQLKMMLTCLITHVKTPFVWKLKSLRLKKQRKCLNQNIFYIFVLKKPHLLLHLVIYQNYITRPNA